EGGSLGGGRAVPRRRHRMLGEAEGEVLPAVAAGLEVARALVLEERLVRRAEVGRAAHEPRDVLGEDVKNLARRVAPGHALRVGREDRQVLVPALGEVAPLPLLDLAPE